MNFFDYLGMYAQQMLAEFVLGISIFIIFGVLAFIALGIAAFFDKRHRNRIR